MGDYSIAQNQKSDKAQTDRTDRAVSALRSGRFQVTRISPERWAVKTGTKIPYAVSFENDMWKCTCLDFEQLGPQILCKHIGAT
jgi:hypothetical protein